jgi:hypothetical protein
MSLPGAMMRAYGFVWALSIRCNPESGIDMPRRCWSSAPRSDDSFRFEGLAELARGDRSVPRYEWRANSRWLQRRVRSSETKSWPDMAEPFSDCIDHRALVSF